jgi:hypothetical protein
MILVSQRGPAATEEPFTTETAEDTEKRRIKGYG